MKNLFRNIYFFVLFLLFNAAGYAQLYPVQLTPVFNSPYSVKISDYATSMDTKMQLLINPTDITISQRRVRLKLYIQGNGLNIQTSDYAQEQRPIYINGGELQTLTNVDIASLFRLENLQGISPAQYANPLPEGMYNFCFELYDFVTNQKISQKSCANLYLILNDPPILNTPQKNEQIASTEFPNILFTWTPRQINATNVSYKFELKQLLDPTLDPQIGFQMSPTLYEETLFGTALLYNLSMPILTPGLRYAWRVRAISTTGLSENAIFKNDGYSEIYSFKYTASCIAPTFLLSEAQSSKSVKITWEGVPEHTRYQVQYKKQDVRNAQWFSTNSLNRQSLITNLEPGVTYQFRVGSSCDPAEDGVQSFTYSNISTFTTPTETSGVPAYNCGIVPQINIQNQKPLTNLIQSETFRAGDFPVTILELQGENSPYSGRGYIIVPYLADTKIAVEFKDIVVNTDYQLISGIVETSYNPDWKNVTDVEDFTGEGQGGQIEEKVPFEVKDIVINPNGDIIVNGKDGEQITIPGGKDTVIIDSKGNTYTVDKDGNGSNEPVIAAAGGKPTPENTDGVDKNGQATAFTAKGISIVFSGNGSKYAFDVMPENASSALKKMYAKAGDNVLPYKAVLNGDTDTVVATVNLTDSNIKLDSVVFKTQNGAKVDFKRTDKVFVLTVKGNLSYAEEQILATIKQGKKWQVIGAFMLVHISPKDVNVALVPTYDNSDSRLNGIIAKTQGIYNKIGVKINFKKEEKLKDFDNVVSKDVSVIQTEKNTITSTYSTQQQDINALYKGGDGNYVLFVTNKTSSTGQEGYMRLNGQFGYVFTNANGQDNSNTAAHELGHGIFKLEHPFEQYKTAEGSTDFLMDYSSGTVLNHMDWKQINDPAFKLYAFQSQSSGEFASGYVVSPNYEVFTVGSERRKVDRNTYSTADVRANDGTIPGFVFKGDAYWWKNGQYVSESGSYTLEKVTNLSSISNKWLYLFFNKDNECGKTTYVTVLISEYLNSKKTLKDFIEGYVNSKNKKTIICNQASESNWSETKGESGNNSQGLFVRNLIKGEVKKEVLDKLESLMSGKSKNWITGQAHQIKGHILLTSEAEKTDRVIFKDNSFYVDNVKDEIKPDEIVFWLEYSNEGKIRVKQILSGSSFDENISVALKSWESSLDWKQKTLFEKIIAIGYESVDGYFTAYYDMFDMLSSGISKVKIKPSVYDCNDKDYNEIYAKVFSYLSLSGAVYDIVAENLADAYPEFNKVFEKATPSQIQFALFCGMYNGLIDVVKSVPDLAKLLISPLSSKGREANSKFLTQIEEMEMFEKDASGKETLIYGKGLSFGKVWYLLKDGIASQFDANKPCIGAEFVGSVVGPIIVMCIGDVEAGAGIVSKVASTAFKAIQLCDKLSDPFRYIGMSFRFVKGVSGKVGVVIKNATSDVITQLDNGLFRLKVIVNNTELPTLEMSFEDVNRLVLAGADGIDYPINGVNQRIKLSVSPGSMGSPNLSAYSAQIFGAANEQLLKRLTDLGVDPSRLEKVITVLGKTVQNGEKLALMLEKAPFKDDIYKIRAFLNDVEASTDLQDFVKRGEDITKEWDVLESYSIFSPKSKLFAQSGAILKQLKSVLNKGHISADDLKTILNVNSGLGKRATDLVSFLDDLDFFALYKKQGGFDAVISGLKANWFNGAGADGANWVIAVLRKEGKLVFVPEKTNFEVVENILGNKRRYDAVVDDAVSIGGRSRKKYFEFKSYSKVPPTDFAKQFLNDLNNADIIDLKQLQWMFDAAKNPPDFVTNMKNAIDNLPLTDEIAKKFLKDVENPTVSKLKKYLKEDFDEIFKLK
ncbi:fibronectin type III domain-containing protein [Flavobacterium sp. UW10123]|uniref:fibronectin type III domain-containing protein n=1 Tax=Flavobacterium sp. UW10123 TaxID=3230800 RepID=UPI00339AEE22